MSISEAIRKTNQPTGYGKANDYQINRLEQAMNEKKAAAHRLIQKPHYQYSIRESLDITDIIPAMIVTAGFWFVLGMIAAIAGR